MTGIRQLTHVLHGVIELLNLSAGVVGHADCRLSSNLIMWVATCRDVPQLHASQPDLGTSCATGTTTTAQPSTCAALQRMALQCGQVGGTFVEWTPHARCIKQYIGDIDDPDYLAITGIALSPHGRLLVAAQQEVHALCSSLTCMMLACLLTSQITPQSTHSFRHLSSIQQT